MKGTGALLTLEAPPPDLRDLTLLGPECRGWLRGRCAAPANGIHSGAWVDARVASLRGPIPRPGASSIARGGKPDISRANKTGHLDVLITPPVVADRCANNPGTLKKADAPHTLSRGARYANSPGEVYGARAVL